ncbi:MAG: MarC family protein [Gammaproteobacteria bacterium]|nr:MarC family protein [Gammaproteobacteria bacterium]
MIEIAGLALTTYFAIISPIGVSAMFAALTTSTEPEARRLMAIRGVLIAAAILLVFALVGEHLLTGLGISLAALRISGGILLLLIGIDKVFARSVGGTSTTEEEELEAETRQDISVFPLATPMLAGPGSMGATILLMSDASGDITQQIIVVTSLFAILLLTLFTLLSASKLQKYLGVTGMYVIGRIMGVLLSALAVQFILDGIEQSGLLGG